MTKPTNFVMFNSGELESHLVEIVNNAVKTEVSRLVDQRSILSKPLLTRKEAASFLGISVPKLDSLWRNKELMRIRIAGCIRYKAVDLLAYVDKLNKPAGN